jgi:hypothetical protein
MQRKLQDAVNGMMEKVRISRSYQIFNNTFSRFSLFFWYFLT